MRCLSEKRLREYMDGELHRRALGRAETHLNVCKNCRERLEKIHAQEEVVNRALSQLDSQLVPQGAFNLHETTGSHKRAPTDGLLRTRIPLPLPLLAGMLVLLLAMVGVVFLQQRTINRLFAKVSATPRPLEIVIGNERSVQRLTLDLDMNGYAPVLNPAIHIVKEKKIL